VDFSKITLLLIAIFSISALFPQETLPTRPSNYNEFGVGTASNPYLISNLANLRWLSECSEEWWMGQNTQVHFLQTTNIDATETVGWNTGAGFRPIGNYITIHPYSELWFVGVYDGDNKTITNLHISQEGHIGTDLQAMGISVGLFGGVSNSIISNVLLVDFDYALISDLEEVIGVFVGGVAGNVHTGSIISNCQVMGNISATGVNNTTTGGIAGFVGYNSTVEDCYTNIALICISTGSCDASTCFHAPMAGGIAGYMSFSYTANSSILRSHSEGRIIANGEYSSIGGVVGYMFSNTNISHCVAIVTLDCNGRSSRVGGISANAQYASIEKSFFSGTIYSNATSSSTYGGNSLVGGIVASHMSSSITNCYSKGTLHSFGDRASSIGGIAGELYGDYSSLINCYSVAEINSLGMLLNRAGGVAGIINSSSIISNCLWNIEITGLSVAVGEVSSGTVMNTFGLPTEEMKQASTYTDLGWDFVSVWDINGDYNESYPYLVGTRPPVSESDDVIIERPQIASLMGNYPNPFNPSTTIAFDLTHKEYVCIDVYNVKGQRVKLLVKDFFSSGQHYIIWNGTDDNGRNVGSGIYFYQLKTDTFVATKKMILVK